MKKDITFQLDTVGLGNLAYLNETGRPVSLSTIIGQTLISKFQSNELTVFANGKIAGVGGNIGVIGTYDVNSTRFTITIL